MKFLRHEDLKIASKKTNENCNDNKNDENYNDNENKENNKNNKNNENAGNRFQKSSFFIDLLVLKKNDIMSVEVNPAPLWGVDKILIGN